nr:hypothetical protein [uncultured Ruegeria sp.]
MRTSPTASAAKGARDPILGSEDEIHPDRAEIPGHEIAWPDNPQQLALGKPGLSDVDPDRGPVGVCIASAEPVRCRRCGRHGGRAAADHKGWVGSSTAILQVRLMDHCSIGV